IELAVLDSAFERQAAGGRFVLVEGAGGIAVPVTDTLDMAGLAARWNLPVLVVARAGLGTLNHTALTVAYARQRGLRAAGIVINGWPEEPGVAESTNPAELERLTRLPILGRVPRLTGFDVEARCYQGLARIAEHLNIEPLLKLAREKTTP
ncbi:dethiobiotin synthase, partial [Candidatus Poribacteria bacterium]|nr:dethiobiotin synthase [Candidatus Poribacteria bacterium]